MRLYNDHQRPSLPGLSIQSWGTGTEWTLGVARCICATMNCEQVVSGTKLHDRMRKGLCLRCAFVIFVLGGLRNRSGTCGAARQALQSGTVCKFQCSFVLCLLTEGLRALMTAHERLVWSELYLHKFPLELLQCTFRTNRDEVQQAHKVLLERCEQQLESKLQEAPN